MPIQSSPNAAVLCEAPDCRTPLTVGIKTAPLYNDIVEGIPCIIHPTRCPECGREQIFAVPARKLGPGLSHEHD